MSNKPKSNKRKENKTLKIIFLVVLAISILMSSALTLYKPLNDLLNNGDTNQVDDKDDGGEVVTELPKKNITWPTISEYKYGSVYEDYDGNVNLKRLDALFAEDMYYTVNSEAGKVANISWSRITDDYNQDFAIIQCSADQEVEINNIKYEIVNPNITYTFYF